MPADAERFERLVLPLRSGLHFAARALTGNDADADDLLQDTLLKAWRSFDTFNRGDNLKAWLYTILRHAWLDRCRHRKLEPKALDPDADLVAAPAPAETALSGDLLAALRRLSPFHQTLLLLCDIEGLRYREIADALGIPIGTVMSGLHNARNRLREQLEAPP
jgi:RNA polymerase sigma-70 factor (ECF subfamily)